MMACVAILGCTSAVNLETEMTLEESVRYAEPQWTLPEDLIGYINRADNRNLIGFRGAYKKCVEKNGKVVGTFCKTLEEDVFVHRLMSQMQRKKESRKDRKRLSAEPYKKFSGAPDPVVTLPDDPVVTLPVEPIDWPWNPFGNDEPRRLYEVDMSPPHFEPIDKPWDLILDDVIEQHLSSK